MSLPSTEIQAQTKPTLYPDDIDYQLLFRHLYKKELRLNSSKSNPQYTPQYTHKLAKKK